jgi:regulator of replication initiation timing
MEIKVEPNDLQKLLSELVIENANLRLQIAALMRMLEAANKPEAK